MKQRDASLTAPVKRLLSLILSEGHILELAGSWRSDGGAIRVHQGTIDAAYDRRLIRITVDSRHRKRHIAKLTEIGQHTAENLERQNIQRDLRFGERSGVSEAAQRLIVEIAATAKEAERVIPSLVPAGSE